jgi:hypothetical protein
MYKCKICENIEFDKYTSLSRHMCRTHKMESEQFYVDYNLTGVWPLCKCGCNQKVKWNSKDKIFRDYCQGHQSRVSNNWGHNPKAIEHSSETRRQQYLSGERQVWNVGLTKETNDSVRAYGEKISERFTTEIRKEYSERMKKLQEDGSIVPLHGPQHSRWKGGTSSISALIYSDIKLYEKWKRPILIRDGFKCIECGSNKRLHVHHDKEMLCEIIKKHVGSGIDTSNFDLKRKIADAVVDYHIKNNVSGVTLCGKCHENKHPSLNFG